MVHCGLLTEEKRWWTTYERTYYRVVPEAEVKERALNQLNQLAEVGIMVQSQKKTRSDRQKQKKIMNELERKHKKRQAKEGGK